jgi:hypothetical protein
VVTVEETGKRTAREVFDRKELQDRAAKSRCRSPKKREPGDDELADNGGLASYDGSASPQSSANKHSADENQPLKRQKRKSYNSSSSLGISSILDFSEPLRFNRHMAVCMIDERVCVDTGMALLVKFSTGTFFEHRGLSASSSGEARGMQWGEGEIRQILAVREIGRREGLDAYFITKRKSLLFRPRGCRFILCR